MPEAERLLVDALGEAHRLGDTRLRADHLLMAILHGEEGGPARGALEACGINYETYRATLPAPEREQGAGGEAAGLTLAPELIVLLARAEGIALGARKPLSVEHLLVALAFDPGQPPALRRLSSLGVAPAALVEALPGAGELVGERRPQDIRRWDPPERLSRDQFEARSAELRAEGRGYRFNWRGQEVIFSPERLDASPGGPPSG